VNDDQGTGQARLDADQRERIAIWGDLDPTGVALREHEAASAATEAPRSTTQRALAIGRQVVIGALALWVFLIALGLMKDGARGLAPSLGGAVGSLPNAVGLGWLGALLVLSGSPIAASSLALLDGGFLSLDESYAMVVGSRLGASFVVLVVGVLYALRGSSSGRRAPISIGILALGMTAVAYVPGGLLGLGVLNSGVLDGLNLTPPSVFFDATEAISKPAIDLIEGVLDPDTLLGAGLLFVAGLVLLLASFRLIDELLPSIGGDGEDERSRWYVGPWTMFGIGLLVALATLSVAVALTLLVPVVAKGYVRREQTLPYIAGANITTLVDTLVVSILLQNDDAPRVVLAVAIGVTVWTVLLLALVYRPLRRAIFALQDVVLRTRTRLVVFTAALFVCPILLLAVR
jgi:solute carrier family 34 (sodium-dependent phosphate cotransporter)